MAWIEMPSFCGAQILHTLRMVNRNASAFEPADVALSKNFFNFPSAKIPFIIFGDVDRGDNICGKHYAKVIEENKLGPIWTSSQKRNPNSGNYVNLFVWEVD